MLKRVLLLFMLLTVSVSADRSQYLKQLDIGVYAYGSADPWQVMWVTKWVAQRYSFVIGTNGVTASRAYLDTMKVYNPSIIVLKYELFVLQASDTVDVKSWAATKGYNFDSLIIRMDSGNEDSMSCRAATVSDFLWWRHTPKNEIVRFSGFTDAQTRFAWDYRNPKVGEYLAYDWKRKVQITGANTTQFDGVFVDEEQCIGVTGQGVGYMPRMFPFATNGVERYLYGSVYTNILRPWGNSFDLEDAGTTHSWTDIRDSVRRAREGWMKVAGDSMASWGLLYAPNFATTPVNNLGNFSLEGRRSAQLARSYVMGEYSYHYPGEPNNQTHCKVAVQACRDVRDDGINFFVNWTRMGQFDLGNGISYDRSKMNGLGHWLNCLHNGTTRYLFSPCRQNGQVYFYGSPVTLNGFTASDTLTHWAYAWGKYFGVPRNTRDTSYGTDPAGQAFQLWKVTLDNPSSPGTPSAIAVGRYNQGGNEDIAATSVAVSLGSTMYELNANGTYSAAVSSTTVGNAHWRIFVADTILANNGIGADTSISILSSSANEGNSGTSTMPFIVSLANGPRSVSTTFTVNTSNGTATSGSDYVAISGQTETIEATHTLDTVNVTINGDATFEQDETFTLTISAPSSPVILSGQSSATGTITNDDVTVDTTISIANANGLETNSGTWNMMFIVTVGNAPSGVSGAKTYTVTTTGVTATAGIDFTAVNQVQTIQSGHTADTIFVPIFGDSDIEGAETFTVTISAPSSGIILGSQTIATGTISNDDSESPSPLSTGARGVVEARGQVIIK